MRSLAHDHFASPVALALFDYMTTLDPQRPVPMAALLVGIAHMHRAVLYSAMIFTLYGYLNVRCAREGIWASTVERMTREARYD